MRRGLYTLVVFALAAPAFGQSGTEVRRLRPVPPPPEIADDYRPGDRWARLELDIDRWGSVTDCRVLQSNEANSERRFLFCRAFMLDYRAPPIMENGIAVPGKITRYMLMRGRNHPRSVAPRERR